MGVIMEYDGVLVADTADLHVRAWQQLAQEEGKPTPLHWALKKAEGMKTEQVHISRDTGRKYCSIYTANIWALPSLIDMTFSFFMCWESCSPSNTR